MSEKKRMSDDEIWGLAQRAFERAGLISSEKDSKLALMRALKKEWMDGCKRRYLSESWLREQRLGLSDRNVKILERYTADQSGSEALIASMGKKLGYTFLIIDGKPYSYRKSYTPILRGGAPQ